MITEEKQLLLKDLCARLPYGVKCREMKLDSQICTLDVNCINHIENYEPYLRPMYSMTEEEKKEFQACHCVYGWHPDFQPTMCNLANECNMFDWLIAHHFDFRGLISKGLALEAPEDMYKKIC